MVLITCEVIVFIISLGHDRVIATQRERTMLKSTDIPATTASPNSFNSPFIETRDRTRLFYKDWGTGKPVVFIHGWVMNADIWEYQMTDLCSQGLRCIAYDRRGCGRSSQPAQGYDYDTFADDLAA